MLPLSLPTSLLRKCVPFFRFPSLLLTDSYCGMGTLWWRFREAVVTGELVEALKVSLSTLLPLPPCYRWGN